MSYTPPAGNAVNPSWVGAPAYTAPAGSAVNPTWAPAPVTGVGACVVAVVAAGAGSHGPAPVVGTGAAVVPIGAGGEGFHGGAVTGEGAAAVVLAAAGVGAHGARGSGACAVGAAAAGVGAHGVAGLAAAVVPLAAAGVGMHPRYELRGEVRLGGVLVNRRVRAYLRSTGELLGQADTVAGRFKVHAGFAEVECYATPVDLDSGAVDWLPPTANRLLPVLADDTA